MNIINKDNKNNRDDDGAPCHIPQDVADFTKFLPLKERIQDVNIYIDFKALSIA